MRPKISNKTILFFARQHFGLNQSQFEEVLKEDSSTKQKLITSVLGEFNGLRPIESEKATDPNFSYANPYGKPFEISLQSVFDVHSSKDLVIEVSNLHKVQMLALEKSRQKVLELESDVKEQSTKTKTRKQELQQEVSEKTQEQAEELER